MTIMSQMELDSSVKNGTEHLKLIFDLCDQDKDGLITADDFRSIGQEYFGPTQQIDALIDTMDPDNSGHISFSMFRHGVETFLIEQQHLRRSRSLSSGTDEENSTTDLSSAGGYDSAFSSDDIYPLHHHLNPSYFSQGYELPSSSVSSGQPIVELVVEATDNPDPSIRTPNGGSSPRSHTPDGLGSRDSPSFAARHLMRRHNQLTLPDSPSQGGTPIELADEEVSKLSDQLMELSSKLEDLQEDKKDSEGVRYKLKRENTELKERLEEYEDQLRQTEHINEQLLNESQDKVKLTEIKVRRQSEQQLMDLKSELHVTREQMEKIKETEMSLKSQLAYSEETVAVKEADITELEHQTTAVKEELRQAREQLRLEREKWKSEVKVLKDDIHERDHQLHQLHQEYDEMQHDRRQQSITASDISLEINRLKKELEAANRRNDELESQFIRQGTELLATSKPQSLAAEMETASKDKVVEVLKESEEQNARLHRYIEGLLTNIMERHPEILEIR